MSEHERYAEIILCDERDKIVKETPTVYEADKIERIYEFADGAIVKYEWQNTPNGRTSATGAFNHRFTLMKLPAAENFQPTIIKQINYPAV